MKTYSQLLGTVDRTFQFSPVGILAIALLSIALPTTAAAQTNDASASQATSRPSRITQPSQKRLKVAPPRQCSSAEKTQI
jgi:hypothetical protein